MFEEIVALLIQRFKEFFLGIGYFGGQESAIYAFYICYFKSWVHMAVYTAVFLFSALFNHLVLKKYIYDPRPKASAPFLANEHIQLTKNGMPSGHAQLTAYSLAFAYLVSGKYLYPSVFLFTLTILQRYVYQNHTALQLFVGSALGVAFAYAAIYLLKYL